MYTLYEQSCYGLTQIKDNSVDAIVCDPPYGIELEHWDNMPNPQIWKDCFRVLKPGAFLLCFSAIRTQHLFTTQLLQAGFTFQDTLLWVYLNGRVPPLDIDKKIDAYLGEDRPVIGSYNYIQGSPNSKKKTSYTAIKAKTGPSKSSIAWAGFGQGLKTAYEPIIMVQKPIEGSIAKNILTYGTGALNLEDTRIAYEEGEKKVGHNPHPKGRVLANIIQDAHFGDYNKFFFVGKVRDGRSTGNTHPTVKPIELMNCLNTLVARPGQTILDPFMGSGSTGVSAVALNRHFIGYENIKEHFEIAKKRIEEARADLNKKI